MGIFFWKNNQAIDVFASNSANELFSVVQKQAINEFFEEASKDKKAKKDKKNVEAHILAVTKKIQQFRISNSLGTYGKARLQLQFNSRLEELGYDANIIRKLNEYILIRIP